MDVVVDLILWQVPLMRHKTFLILSATPGTAERLLCCTVAFLVIFSSSSCYTVLWCSAEFAAYSCCAVCWGLYIAPYPVGLISLFIHTETMLTEALRSFLAVIKPQGTVTPIGFWSTGAANSKSGKKNQNFVFLSLLKILHFHSPFSVPYKTHLFTIYYFLFIMKILLIIMQRGKSPVQQRLKNHLRLVYIHDCLALWKNLQPFVTFISTNPEKKKSLT